MGKKLDPKEVVADATELQDEICEKCGALVIQTEDGPLCNCNFSATKVPEMPAASKESAPEVPEAPVDAKPAGEQPVFSTREALKKIKGAPDETQLQTWKDTWGAIYSMPFDTREIYIWRPLRRREFQTLKSNEALASNEEKFQEYVVMRSVLWPVLESTQLNLSRAGLIQTLYGVIMQGSYFLHPDFAVTLVEEL